MVLQNNVLRRINLLVVWCEQIPFNHDVLNKCLEVNTPLRVHKEKFNFCLGIFHKEATGAEFHSNSEFFPRSNVLFWEALVRRCSSK